MKNVLKYTLLILVIIIIIVVGVICFKQINEKNNNNKTQEGITTIEKYKPLEKLGENDSDFNLNNFIENKCYIVLEGNIVYHKKELDKFIENVNSNIPDKIRIIQYTSDYKYEFKDFEFNNGKFIIKIDNRWDPDLPEENRKIITNEYASKKYKLVKENIKNNNLKTYDKINLVSKNNSDSIYICDYIETVENNESKFELEFNKDLTKGRNLILSKNETTKYDYDIYSYNGTVNIIIDGKKISLREALLSNKITIDEILEKGEKDAEKYKTIFRGIYLDGGSKDYLYNDYTILKFNKMKLQEQVSTKPNNKDLYIGNPAMDINDLEKLYYNNL